MGESEATGNAPDATGDESEAMGDESEAMGDESEAMDDESEAAGPVAEADGDKPVVRAVEIKVPVPDAPPLPPPELPSPLIVTLSMGCPAALQPFAKSSTICCADATGSASFWTWQL